MGLLFAFVNCYNIYKIIVDYTEAGTWDD
jgi:hypothetical protein